jgi:hypothetical protein
MTDFPYKGLNERSWQLISLSTSFPSIITLTLLLIAYRASPNLSAAVWNAGVYLSFFVLLPSLTILAMYWKGWISDLEVRDRHERDRAYPAMIIYSFLGLGALRYAAVSSDVLFLGVIQTVLVITVFFINKSWKISIHTTSWGACLTALLTQFGAVSLLLVPVAVPMTYSRFALDCHDRNQVIAGYVLGFLITALVFLRP